MQLAGSLRTSMNHVLGHHEVDDPPGSHAEGSRKLIGGLEDD